MSRYPRRDNIWAPPTLDEPAQAHGRFITSIALLTIYEHVGRSLGKAALAVFGAIFAVIFVYGAELLRMIFETPHP